jgi:hypothetical protein
VKDHAFESPEEEREREIMDAAAEDDGRTPGQRLYELGGEWGGASWRALSADTRADWEHIATAVIEAWPA